MSFFDQLLKGTKTTKRVVELEIEKKKLEKKMFNIIKSILFEKEYKTVEKDDGLYICMKGKEILDLTDKLIMLEEKLKKEKSEYKNLFKKENNEEDNNEIKDKKNTNKTSEEE